LKCGVIVVALSLDGERQGDQAGLPEFWARDFSASARPTRPLPSSKG
jgi:hypothetical protein